MNNKNNMNISVPEKPPVNRTAFLGMWCIIIFLIIFMLWAFFSSIESAALAPGKIVVAGSKRVVQHLEGGIISKINVKNGMAVTKGQLLLKIDDTQSFAKFELEHGQFIRLLADEARLVSLIDDKDNIEFPDIVIAAGKSLDVKKYLDNQNASFMAEKATKTSHLKILKQRILQLQEQIEGVNAQLIASSEQLKLIKEELVSLVKLAKEELVDRSRLLSMQREEQRLKGSRGEYQANIANLKQKIGETELEIIAEQDKLNKTWNEELRNIREKLAQSDDRNKSAQDIYDRTKVISPIDGIVTNLNVFTIGGVVKPGETLLEIVPQHEELLVEAKVNPMDIDIVHPGLTAKVTLTAFKTRTTPTLLGVVNYVSADVKVDERTQMSYYEARIQINQNELKKISGKLLYPGMPVAVMIITNKMSPWNYFMDPVKRSFARAFREE